MLVTKLAEQALRPKRIDSLTLPMATFGGPLIAGVRHKNALTREKIIRSHGAIMTLTREKNDIMLKQ